VPRAPCIFCESAADRHETPSDSLLVPRLGVSVRSVWTGPVVRLDNLSDCVDWPEGSAGPCVVRKLGQAEAGGASAAVHRRNRRNHF